MKRDFDVVIVGGGGSGLAAAVSAAEHGAEVLLLEKQQQLGGTTGIAVGSFTASGTRWQQRAGIRDAWADHVVDAGRFAPDEIEARNRAMIAAQLGREVRAGAVTIDDVVMMSEAGVDDELIINHIRANGITRVPGPHELVNLKNSGVSTAVIRAMQEPPRPRTETVVIERPTPAPVIVEEYHYGPPVFHRPPYYHYRRRHPGPRVGWGVSFHN